MVKKKKKKKTNANKNGKKLMTLRMMVMKMMRKVKDLKHKDSRQHENLMCLSHKQLSFNR